MLVSDPLNTLAYALHAALARDLPDRKYLLRGKPHTSRPRREDVEVLIFPQQWPSTALGFDDDTAGQAFCSAYTAVITCDRTACVYFGERLAYSASIRNQDFLSDLAARDLAGQADAKARYGADLPA